MHVSFMLSAGAESGEIVDDIRDQAEAAGHTFEVTRGRFLPPPAVNVFSEGAPESGSGHAAGLAAQGYRLVVLVSELATLVTDEGLVWNYWTSDDWLRRAEEFVRAAPHFTAAWCYVPGSSRGVSRFCRRVADVDLAWGKRFDGGRPAVQPRQDFCFYGRPTARRDRVLNEFARRGHSVDVVPFSTSLSGRDLRIPHSKVVLDVKQHDWWPVASYMRYLTAIGCGRPVVAEARAPQAQRGWVDIVRFAEEGMFYEAAAAALAEGPWLHAAQMAALKAKPLTVPRALAALEG